MRALWFALVLLLSGAAVQRAILTLRNANADARNDARSDARGDARGDTRLLLTDARGLLPVGERSDARRCACGVVSDARCESARRMCSCDGPSLCASRAI